MAMNVLGTGSSTVTGRLTFDTDGNNNEWDSDNGVWDSGVANQLVELIDTRGDIVGTTTTNSYGTYVFSAVPAGQYSIQLPLPDQHEFSTINTGVAEHFDSDVDASGRSAFFTLTDNQTLRNIDAGVTLSVGTLSGRVFADDNGNGSDDRVVELGDNLIVNGDFESHGRLQHGSWGTFSTVEGWAALQNVIEIQEGSVGGTRTESNNAVVELDAHSNGIIAQQVAIAEAGTYQFSIDYALRGDNPVTNGVAVYINGVLHSTLYPTSQDPETETLLLELDVGNTQVELRALGTSDSIGSTIDNLTLQHYSVTEEAGESGVTVHLLSENGQPIVDENGQAITTLTDTHGDYSFENIASGNYRVHVETDDDQIVTEGSVVNSTGVSDVIHVSTGVITSGVDAGIEEKPPEVVKGTALFGDSDQNALEGAAGNDFLFGDGGDDSYLFKGDFGKDIINNRGSVFDTDTARFSDDLSIYDLWFSRDGDHLTITVAGTDNQVIIANWFVSDDYHIDQIAMGENLLFINGINSLIDAMAAFDVPFNNAVDSSVSAQLASAISDAWETDTSVNQVNILTGNEADDVLGGYDGHDKLYGNDGNDTLSGGEGNDRLFGGLGNDILWGEDGRDNLLAGVGDDILYGGAGNDFLFGDGGNDTYVFTGDFGQDVINNSAATFDTDVLRFNELTVDNLWFSRSGSDLVITVIGTENNVSIMNWFVSDMYQVDSIELADGYLYINGIENLVSAMATFDIPADQTAADALSSQLNVARASALIVADDGSEANEIVGSSDNDTLEGHGGNDRLESFDGDDTLYGGDGNDFLIAGIGSDILFGDAGHDTLLADGGNDWLNGGAGNDYLFGDGGNDTYAFSANFGEDKINNLGNSSDTDTIQFTDSNLRIDDIFFSRSDTDLEIILNGGGDKVTVSDWYVSEEHQVDTIELGGSVLHAHQVDTLVSAMSSLEVGDTFSQDLLAVIDDTWA